MSRLDADDALMAQMEAAGDREQTIREAKANMEVDRMRETTTFETFNRKGKIVRVTIPVRESVSATTDVILARMAASLGPCVDCGAAICECGVSWQR